MAGSLMCFVMLPLTGRSHAFTVVDDVRRDEDEKVALLFGLLRDTEQLANQRKIDEHGDAALALSNLRDGEAADHRGLAVIHEQTVVGALFVEYVADVRTGKLRIGIFGVHVQQHLVVVRDVRRDLKDDTHRVKAYRCPRLHRSGSTRLLRAYIQDSYGNILPDLNAGLSVIHGDDAWLRLQIREAYFLKRVEKAGEREVTDRSGVHELQRG